MSEIRKLAAILVADVVGFSRLAGASTDWRKQAQPQLSPRNLQRRRPESDHTCEAFRLASRQPRRSEASLSHASGRLDGA